MNGDTSGIKRATAAVGKERVVVGNVGILVVSLVGGWLLLVAAVVLLMEYA